MGHDEDKNFNALNELNRISGGSFSAPTGTGDIILNGTPGKKKTFLVVVVAIIFLALVLIAILILRSTGIFTGGLAPEYADAYDSYSKYLINSDSNNATSVDDAIKDNAKIYPFTVKNGFSRSDNQKMEKYFEELDKRFEELKNKSDSKNDTIQKAITENEVLLDTIEKTANHTKYLRELRQAFDNNQSQIDNIINNTFKYDGDDPYLKTIVERQKTFYSLYIKEYALYKNNGCYKNSYYDLECMAQRGQSVPSLKDKTADVVNAYGAMNEDGLKSILSHKIIIVTMQMGGKDVTTKK